MFLTSDLIFSHKLTSFIVQYLLDLTDPHIAALGFNRPYFRAGFFFCVHQTSLVEIQKVQHTLAKCEKIGSGRLSPPPTGGNNLSINFLEGNI
jgi:hypothetical protein